jgi:hypothetical protein
MWPMIQYFEFNSDFIKCRALVFLKNTKNMHERW